MQEPQARRTSAPTEADAQEQADSMGGCFTRLGWLIVAPLALLGLGASIVRNDASPASLQSALYWMVVLAAVAIRHFDITRLQGETAAGKPASRKDWQRYAVWLPLIALAGWFAAVWLA